MKSVSKIMVLLAFLVPSAAFCEASSDRATVLAEHGKGQYPIAGPRPGKPLPTPKPEIPQSTASYELMIPGFSSLGSLQFSSLPTSSLLVLAYSTALPAFVWLSGTSRTPKMKKWFSSFQTGFISFAILLKLSLYVGLPVFVSVVLALLAAASGYIGFRHPDEAYVLCGGLWGSYVLTNLLHILFFTNDGNMHEGIGQQTWVLYLLSIAVFGMYLLVEQKDRVTSQNFITAFTSAFASVACLSFILTYFLNHEYSPFDALSFMTYPTGFRWDDAQDVFLLVVWIALMVVGICLAVYRDKTSSSPGFGDDKTDSLALAKGLATGGYQRVTSSISSISIDSTPFLYFVNRKEAGGQSRKVPLLPFGTEVLSGEERGETLAKNEKAENAKDETAMIAQKKSIFYGRDGEKSNTRMKTQSTDLWELEDQDFCSLLTEDSDIMIEAY